MSTKIFSFNASSFALDQSVESFLKSKGAISLDFGAMAYINSEAMPAIFSEVVERSKADASTNADMMAQLRAELGRFGAERQKIMEDNIRLASQLRSSTNEVAALKEKFDNTAKIIETLKAENLRLQAAKNATTSTAQTADPRLKESYEKLQKEFQQLRSQSAEAITSLKVLEEENEELNDELERLRSQMKNAPSLKAS